MAGVAGCFPAMTLKKTSSLPRRVSVQATTTLLAAIAMAVRSPRLAVMSLVRLLFESFDDAVLMRWLSNGFPPDDVAKNVSAD